MIYRELINGFNNIYNIDNFFDLIIEITVSLKLRVEIESTRCLARYDMPQKYILFKLIRVTKPPFYFCSSERRSFDFALSLSGNDKPRPRIGTGIKCARAAGKAGEKLSLRKTFRARG